MTDSILYAIFNKGLSGFELCYELGTTLPKIERELYRINFFISKPHIFESKIKTYGFDIKNTKKQKEIDSSLYYRKLDKPYIQKRLLFDAYIEVRTIVAELPLLISFFKSKKYSQNQIAKMLRINHSLVKTWENKETNFLYPQSQDLILDMYKKNR